MEARTLATVTSDEEFHAWLEHARCPSVIEYYRGFLAVDVDPYCSAFGCEERSRFMGLRQAAAVAAGRGLVDLVQRRLGAGQFSYRAIIRKCRGGQRTPTRNSGSA